MKIFTLAFGATALALAIGAGLVAAQQPQQTQGPQPFSVGNRLGLPINPAADGAFNPMSSNVKVYGAIYSAESCSYDPVRNLIVVPNRSVGQDVQTNKGGCRSSITTGPFTRRAGSGFRRQVPSGRI
jgi:hypothetical protein